MNTKEQVEFLLKKCSPKSLQLAVNFISHDSTYQELRSYLLKYNKFSPDQRELIRALDSFDDQEIAALVSLSRCIANSKCSLNSIIPLNSPKSDLKDSRGDTSQSPPNGKGGEPNNKE